jgi:hypothetical protein
MEIVGTSSFQRRRAVAVSVVLVTALLSGFGPANAHAETVVVEGTVDGCVITISGTGTVDLGSPALVDSAWVFDTTPAPSPAFTVDWSTGSANDCAGSLHAQHAGITKTVGETTNSSMGADISVSGGNLASPADWVGLSASPIQVAISTVESPTNGTGAGDQDNFDVKLEVPTSEGNGDYSATITFTVVAE